MTKRRLIKLALPIAVAFMFLLSLACSSESEQVSVKLALDWYPNSNHLGFYVAQNKGYFADENLDVELYTPVDPSTVLQTVAAGKDEFGISYQPDVLMARAQGVEVVSVAGMVQHPLNSVMALKSSGIERPSDLVGKKIGYPSLPIDEPLLDTMLKADGANGLSDVEMVNVGFNLTESLLGGTVDAIIGAYWTHESILLENMGQPVNILKVQDWGVPDYYELVLVTGEKYIEENSDVVERFTRALSKGFADAIADPQAGVNILIESSNEEVDRAIEGPGAELLVPLWKESGGKFGAQTSARWEDFANWMHETGVISEEVDASKAFTDEYIK